MSLGCGISVDPIGRVSVKGFFVVCLYAGAGGVLLSACSCAGCLIAAGCVGASGLLPGRGVPLFTLNHVSPVQCCP